MNIWESINGRSWQIIAESAVISRKLAQALLLYILVVISELCVHGVVPIFGNSVYKYCCARLSANWTCYVTSRHAIKPMHFRRKKSWRDMSRLSGSMVRHARHDERDTSPHDTHDVCVVSTVSLRKAQIPLVASRHDTHDVTWRDVTQQVEFELYECTLAAADMWRLRCRCGIAFWRRTLRDATRLSPASGQLPSSHLLLRCWRGRSWSRTDTALTRKCASCTGSIRYTPPTSHHENGRIDQKFEEKHSRKHTGKLERRKRIVCRK